MVIGKLSEISRFQTILLGVLGKRRARFESIKKNNENPERKLWKNCAKI